MAEDQSSGERTQSGADAALAATREILAAISEHRSDEKQVFDVILENACKLCNAQTAFVAALDDAETHLVIPAWRGASDAFADGLKEFRHAVTETHLTAVQAMVERQVIRIDDIADTDTYREGEPVRVFMVDVENIRSLATVPLLSEGRGIGSILLYRREVDPFTDDDIALIEGFAEQAVIAIENARQFRELQERLEREKASAEILDVISRSRDDEVPVFDVILENAARLCGAPMAGLVLLNEPGDTLIVRGVWGDDDSRLELPSNGFAVDGDFFPARAFRAAEILHIPDIGQVPEFIAGNPRYVALVEERGFHSYLCVPLLQNGKPIGCIDLFRTKAAPFSDRQIALVKTFATQAIIAIENVRQFREVQERLERERASAEILEVISKSRDDEAPVFDVILEQAARLCRSPQAGLIMPNESRTHVRYTASWGPPTQHFEVGVSEWEIDEPIAITTAIRECRTVNIPDTLKDAATEAANPSRMEIIEKEGIRSVLAVPLVMQGEAIGCFDVYRTEVDPFSDDDVALMETFAAQAVIAIENVRQFREVQERLERETATKNILRVISQSRDDEAPVFDAILDSATRLCDAESGSLMLINDQRTHTELKARSGKQWGFEVEASQWPLDLGHAQTEAARTGEVVHEVDLKDSDIYRSGDETRVMLVDKIGLRTALAVPLLQGDTPIGVIVLHRLEVARAFSDNDIKLVESFAAQAVIAIENVRQFRELQERLQREAATKNVLRVISESRDDDGPVFDAILDSAAHLCDAKSASLMLLNEEGTHNEFQRVFGRKLERKDSQLRWALNSGQAHTEAVRTGAVVHVHDLRDTELYRNGDETRVRLVDDVGVSTALSVPILRDQAAIGAIALTRHGAPRPFSDNDIQLVESFAAQAVIAIENVRQFREVQERLERERASAEILEVISKSRDDEKPVFDTILENTAHLCQTDLATFNLMNNEGTHLEYAAHYGRSLHTYEVGVDRWSIDSTLQIAESVREGRIVHNVDLRETQLYLDGDRWRRQLADEEGVRSFLTVPLIAAGREPIGCIGIYRKEVRAFTDDEIAMVETFAAQAVIAIENVRQFRELQERLEREAATGEVLGVISTSRDDETPVFDAIIENASRLCKAPIAFLSVANEERTEVTIPAHLGTRSEFGDILEDFREPITRTELVAIRPVATGEMVLEDDIKDDDAYRNGDPRRLQMVDVEGARSVMAVPLIRNEVPIGAIVLYRREVAPFSADDLSLVKSFAAQAVIAIENVRQFKALETLNAELGDRVQDQVGEIERMGRLKRFLPSAVADAVVTSGDESMLTSHRAMVATLFCDMRGFTAFCEAAEPEETIDVLQTYHQEMSDLIDEFGGGVDQRAGDGIMVIFNDPIPVDDPAGDAVRLAVAMREKMRELCAKWKRLGHRLGFGVGISLGYATVGMVGSAGRFDYTASGTSVNTAARLCDMAADGEILISPRVWVAVEGNFQAESRGEVEMKGIREPVEVFGVV